MKKSTGSRDKLGRSQVTVEPGSDVFVPGSLNNWGPTQDRMSTDLMPALSHLQGALERHMSARTLRLHYGRRRQAYADSLNRLAIGAKMAGRLLVEMMNAHMARAVNEKFSKVREAMKKKSTSVEAGREYVEAYVIYMHYVEGIHAAIMSTGGHQHTESSAALSGHDPRHQ